MDARQVFEEVNKGLMPQYGSSMHYPYCRQASCTGCVPAVRIVAEPEGPKLDLSIFRKD